MKKKIEEKQNESGLYAAGLELPKGMTYFWQGDMIYFLSIDKRDFLTLSRKLQQVQLAASMEFYPTYEKFQEMKETYNKHA